ncbi:MAG: glycosyltransferase family 2 protein [Ignavibacteriaceae bacterium]|nr:MAG: glycosyltransferase [Chlorobi bacterium OLB4]MBV6399207.1 putative glycosyltransferase [Ignavibacteria bacterium]MCC6885346.1 glycosyltransferase [Ignavibacteriales bacterium]MEB2329995.1 glycosyltransferase family 2 protein [Ignavibacteriaceae bacterium]
MNKPTVDIITVVLNRKTEFEKTINSIFRQRYVNLNLIVIDGGSVDGTIDLLKLNSDKIKFWMSEPDSGIYDAMNKGLKHSEADYVWFINSGDEIYSEDLLSKVFEIPVEYDAYYGDMVYIDEQGNNLGRRTLKSPPDELSWKSFINGMVVSHQSLIIKRTKAVDYNLSYKHVADLDWCIRSLKNCSSILNTKLTLSKFLVGGYSKKNIVKSNIERFKILLKHFNPLQVIRTQLILAVKFVIYFFSTRKKYY